MARIPTFTRLTTFTAGLLLTSAVMVQAQTCTTTYNAMLAQWQTQCASGPAVLGAMMQSLATPIPQYDPQQVAQQAEQIKAQRLQNEILRLQLQELQRQQALRQQGR